MSHSSALQRACHHATAYLDGLASRPVNSTVGLDELRARLGGPVPETGSNPSEVIDDLVANTAFTPKLLFHEGRGKREEGRTICE